MHDLEDVLGPEHPEVVTALHRHANLDLARGEPEAAIATYERALSSLADGGEGETVRLSLLQGLAKAHLGAGRPTEAVQILERALADRERMDGNNVRWIAETLLVLADAEDDLGHAIAAATCRERARALRDATNADETVFDGHAEQRKQ